MPNTALYIIEKSFNTWLQEQNEQEEPGVKRADMYCRRGVPGEGIRLVDQLLYNHNYYAIQFSNLAIEYLNFEIDNQTTTSIEKVVCLLIGRYQSWTAELSRLDWVQITTAFQDGGRVWDGVYLPQHLDIAYINNEIDSLRDPIAFELWEYAKKYIEEENAFYYLLRKKKMRSSVLRSAAFIESHLAPRLLPSIDTLLG